jgi:hypothetical protein
MRNFSKEKQKQEMHTQENIESLVIKAMQSEATLKYHLTPTKLAVFKMTGWQGDSGIGVFIHFNWRYRLEPPLRKQCGNRGETFLPFGPAIPVRAISAKGSNSPEAETHSALFFRASAVQ